MLLRLAVAHKRASDRDLAEPHWAELAASGGRGGLRAYVELAIYYEHHVRDLALATSVVERALASVSQAIAPWDQAAAGVWRSALQHRKSRLERRIGS